MTALISSANRACGNQNSAATNAASRIAAVRTRVRNKRLSVGCGRQGGAARLTLRGFLQLLAGATEAPLALPVGSKRLVERCGVEIGPQRGGEMQLAIRELPEQEIADTLLAAGADEKIRFRRIAHGQIGRQVLFLNFFF